MLTSQSLKMHFGCFYSLSVIVLLQVYANLILIYFQIRTQYHFYDKTKTESKFQSTTTGSTPITAAQKSSWRQNQTNLASTESGQQNIKSEKVTPSNYFFANKVKLSLDFSFFFFHKHIRPERIFLLRAFYTKGQKRRNCFYYVGICKKRSE